jgi:UDP-N-acetylmuramate dehydrogenase
MQIQENILLAPYTTFKIGGPARWFCVVENQFDALEAFEFAKNHQLKTFVLGGGSNILVSDEGFDGLVIKVVNKGIEVLSEKADDVLLKVASGEVWDEVVKFAVKNNWWGIENLSHIPGSTGAIAVQNVGAYGQEAGSVILAVTVFDTVTHQIISLPAGDCKFGYRQSIFNSVGKGKYIIFDITFKLSKQPKPNLEYRDLKNYFGSQQTLSVASNATSPPEGERNKVLSLSEIRKAIIYIRDKKFPFPVEAKKGNAGSFFKNPILSEADYYQLQNKLADGFGKSVSDNLEKKKFIDNEPSAVAEAMADDRLFNKIKSVKIPAAFLIDMCGLKNLQSGGAAINPGQPLVIINQTGTATAKDVLNLANQVKSEVLAKTGIELKFEPELIGF